MTADDRRSVLETQVSREGLVAAAVALGAAAVVALWLQDTPAGALHGLGDELTAVGRLTGLVGTYLLLVEVLLLGRIPWLDRAIGMDRLVVWHRRNGEYVVGLLAAHAVATVAGYAIGDHVSLFGETGTVVLHYPDVLAATVALGLLVLVGVVSAQGVRHRLSYHSWYFLHLYTYLAVVLAFAHQLATGDEFADDAMHRVFWVALHLATAILLLGYRVAVPAAAAWRHRLRVEAVVPEGNGVVSIHVTGEHLDELGAEPGQFFLWRFLTRHGWWQAHPFSLSAVPDGRRLRITVKALGDHTATFAALRPGTRVIAEGPYGNVTGRRRTRRKVLLVAGGIGIAPLRAMFESLPGGPGDLTLLYRATSTDDLVLRSELEELARRRQGRLAYVVGPRHPDPFTPERVRTNVPDVAHHDAFVCGSSGFVDHVVATLRGAGVPSRQIHAERFEL